ncbi:MAG: hypothetical protein ACXU86_22705, partial [Archangium sp.]
AYPAVPPDMQAHNAANEPLVANILHEVLTQLRNQAREHGGPKVLGELELPVPSRLLAIAELEARGYEVKGDVATLRRTPPGLVNRLAGWLTAEKVKVPPEATAPEFLELARRALDALPGWPSETERVLRARVRPGNGAPPRAQLPSAMVSQPPAPVPPRIPPRPPPAPARPSDWMQDFLDAHARPGATKAKLTRSRTAPAPRQAASSPQPADTSPEWMSDFTSSPPPARQRREPSAAPASAPAKKPDWMSDFED